MKKILLTILSVLMFSQVFCQYGFENMVELTGVVMSSDSLRYLPYVTVSIPSKDRGTLTTDHGVFSIIAEKGDTLEFSSIGFRNRRYILPKDLTSNRYSIIQLMTQDTFYLAPTFIHAQLSPEEFDRAFKTWDIPDDKYEVARKNTAEQTMKIMLATLPKDGRETQQIYQQIKMNQAYWAGQQPPQKIFSPIAWAEFLRAWKRGDFKRKKQ